MMSELKREIVSRIERENILALLKEGKRIDNRGFFDYRKIKVIPDIIEKADGSAFVSVGNTKVVAGLKVSLAKPFPDTPDKGVFVINAEFNPVASPAFELGPPPDYAVELSRVVDRAIRSAEMIALDELVLIPGKVVWMLNVDIYPLDDDGNLIDAAMYASVAALLSGTLPKAEVVDEEKEQVEVIKEERVPIPIREFPVTITFAKIEDFLVVDPNRIEENLMSSRLTIAFTQAGDICTIQKGEGGGFKFEEILRAKDVAAEKAKEIRDLIADMLAKRQPEADVWSLI